MKHILLLTLLASCLTGVLSAQPLYIQFDATCMNQLEYRYVYTGATAMSYAMQPSAGEQFQLQAGAQGIQSPTLPPNIVKCREYNFNDQFLNEVNNLSRQVYMVHQQAKGFLLVPIISAAQIIRSGPFYMVRARNYSFAVDTSNLVYEGNIATGSSDWYIYFNGLKIRGCYYEYSFKREPTRVNQERSEFDFIPGIGLSTERTGMTAAEAENNQYRLVKINNIALEDYITAQCTGRAPATAPLSKYAPQVEYGVVREGDKETASMGKQQPAGTTGPPSLINCPEAPGEGYHIVQPGETLNAISRGYKVPVKSLVAWNKIKDPDRISVCQKIWVRKPPANAAPAAQTVAAAPAQYATTPNVQVAARQDAYWQQQPGQTVKKPEAPTTVYNLTQPQMPSAFTPQSKTLVHVVQSGETLFGIGQRYGVSEAEMRRLNNFPQTGQVNIQPGMQLFVADCCPPGTTATPTQPTATQPAAATTTQPAATTTQPATTTTPQPGALPGMFGTQPTAPVAHSQPTSPQPSTTTPTTTTPTYFQEYVVREGDTINSIAIRFKVSAQELALVNSKDPNETLIAGQRILIPRY